MTFTGKLIDIGANLTDKVFRGIYRGRQCHPDDFSQILHRAFDEGRLERIIVTAAHEDLIGLLDKAMASYWQPGQTLCAVVHTFDGSVTDAKRLLDRGFYLGLNGCSLKTETNLEVVKTIPVDRILLETDAPWCEIRPTHAGYSHIRTHQKARKPDRWAEGCLVKGRNEPVNLIQVLEVVAGVKEMSVETLAAQVYQNTMKLFQFPA